MHYERTGEVICNGARALWTMPAGSDRDKAFAWLLGYAAHVGMDLTIHPVIERRVGPYAQNKAQQRTCEMHQDVVVWEVRGLAAALKSAPRRGHGRQQQRIKN